MKSKTYTGIIWSFAKFIITFGIPFIIGIFLARLLMPEDYGLIGMVTIIIAVANSLIDSGFSQALIRKKNVSQEDYSTIFYFNLLISLILYLIIFLCAKIISDFYSEPRLIPIIRIISLVIIINSLSIIQRTILIKKIDFKSQALIVLISSTISGIIAIFLAYNGFGVWSLVFNTLISNFLQTLLLWIYNKWIPSFVFNFTSFKSLLGFSSKLLASGMIDTIYQNIYSPIIGKSFSVVDLGYYTNAVKYKNILSNMISSSIQQVTYPVLSEIKENKVLLKKNNKKLVRTTMFLQFPLMIGLLVVAEPLFFILFGEKWLNSIPYFQLLCIVGILYPLHTINLNILKVIGRSDLFLRLEIYKKISFTILIVIFFQWGIIGLIIAQVINSILSYIINSYYSGKYIDYHLKEQIKDFLPVFIISLLMGIIVFLSSLILPDNYFIKLSCEVIIGVIFYLSICKLAKIKELDNLLNIFFSYLKDINFKKKKKESSPNE
nr:lipopolysaccharide biosynthesis protein [Candidatus Prometheoarchaeum syntrophicum]